MNRFLLPLCLVGLIAQPLAAQKVPGEVAAEIVGLLGSTNEIDQLAGSYMACLAGAGLADRSVAIFERAGWMRGGDSEAGLIEFYPPGAYDPYVAIGASHPFCGVWSEEIGTDIAGDILGTVFLKGDYRSALGTSPDGCLSWQVGPGMTAELTSSGQDPSCESDYSSTIRFEGFIGE